MDVRGQRGCCRVSRGCARASQWCSLPLTFWFTSSFQLLPTSPSFPPGEQASVPELVDFIFAAQIAKKMKKETIDITYDDTVNEPPQATVESSSSSLLLSTVRVARSRATKRCRA